MGNNWTNDIVSAADCLSNGFNFKVDFNGITFGFQSVSGIEVTRKVEFYDEGGVNDHRIMLGKPQDDTPELTFTRGLILRTSSAVTGGAKAAIANIKNNTARKTAFFALNALDPQELLEIGPALGTITVYSTTRRGQIAGMYSFLALGITKWALSDLDSRDGSSLLIETFTVVHTGITRMPLSAPSGQYYLGKNTEIQEQERIPVEVTQIDTEAEAALRERPGEAIDRDLLEVAKNTAEEMAAINAERGDDSLEALKAMQEKMEEEYQNSEKLREEWQKLREEGITKAEELRKKARGKADKYLEESKKLTDSIIKAEKENLEKIREYSKELAKTTQKAADIAKESAEALSVEIEKLREKKRKQANEIENEMEDVEKAKLAALKALELSKAMAKASREAAKELLAKKWEEMKQKNQDEIDKLQEEFENQRQKGLEATEEKRSELRKKAEEFEEMKEKVAKETEAFEKASQEALKERRENAQQEFEEMKEKVAEETEAFEKASQEALKERRENAQQKFEEMAKEAEEKKAAFEAERKKMKEEAKELAMEAEEAAAEAENNADYAETIFEAAS